MFFRSLFKKKKAVICTPSGYVCPQSISHCQRGWTMSCTVLRSALIGCHLFVYFSSLVLPSRALPVYCVALCSVVSGIRVFLPDSFLDLVCDFALWDLFGCFALFLFFFPHTHDLTTFDFTFYIIDFCSEPCCMWSRLLGQNLSFPVCFD